MTISDSDSNVLKPSNVEVDRNSLISDKQRLEEEQNPKGKFTETRADGESALPSPIGSNEASASEEKVQLDVPASSEDTAHSPAPATEGSLDLHIVDAKGNAIANLQFKVIIQQRIVSSGKSDAKGRIPTIENIPIGSRFEVFIRKDSGEYKLAAIGKIACEENYGCLKSPKTRFEFSSYSYDGIPGTAEKHKETVTDSHNQKPSAFPEISGNVEKKPEIKADRDASGKPKATIIDGVADWFNRNGIANRAVDVGTPDIERVNRLIEFGERQAAWRYEDSMPTDAIIDKMRAKSFVPPAKKEKDGFKGSVHACNKYVKIALWYAGYGPADKSIGSGVIPAREMGSHLVSAGFKDITKELPDGRWAAPGDVIVYKRLGAPQDNGHIDIRTYDGYLSDFLGGELPMSQFEVTGIYRKYYDPEPEKRMRAFLKVIREWECHEEGDDRKRYFLMAAPIDGSRRFTDTSKHPYTDHPTKSGTPAGAYQMTLGTYNRVAIPRFQVGAGYSPTNQDRLAVALIESQTKTKPLAKIRKGEIDRAARELIGLWASLPGGGQDRHEKRNGVNYGFTMSDVIERYSVFLAEANE